MRRILLAWIAVAPSSVAVAWAQPPLALQDLKTGRKLTVVYVVPQDRQPVDRYRERITVLLTFANQLFREVGAGRDADLALHGLDFEFDDREPPLINVHELKAPQPASFYTDDEPNSVQQFHKLATLVTSRFKQKPGERSFLVFAETYDPDSPAEFEWKGGIAMGGNHVGIFSAWILQPQLCAVSVDEQMKLLWDETPIPGRLALGHGRIDSPRFQFIEDGFGAVAHELGHSLGGLPHDDDEWSVMSNGFRRLRENFRLNQSPAKLVERRDGSRVYFVPDHAERLRMSEWVH